MLRVGWAPALIRGAPATGHPSLNQAIKEYTRVARACGAVNPFSRECHMNFHFYLIICVYASMAHGSGDQKSTWQLYSNDANTTPKQEICAAHRLVASNECITEFLYVVWVVGSFSLQRNPVARLASDRYRHAPAKRGYTGI